MVKLSLNDKVIRSAMNGEALPLIGRTRIIFTDEKTGKKEVIEHKNEVTSAITRIINANFTGATDIFSLLPLRQFFSGVLCFGNAINGIPTAPENQNVNPLIAHAGTEAPTQQTASSKRGTPTYEEWEETDDALKMVWDFSTSIGNGTIRTVCLCPDVLGNYGLMPVVSDPVFWTNGGSKTYSMQTSETERDRIIKNPIEITSANECISIYINGTTFEEITSVHDYLSFGFLRSGTEWTESSSRTTTIRSFSTNKALLAFDDDYYYVYEITSNTAIKIDKIDRSDLTVTTADLSLSGTSLYYGSMQIGDGYVKFAFDGTYLYLPHSDKNKIYKVNISDASDVTLLNGTATLYLDNGPDSSNSPCLQPIVVNDGLILGENYIINYDTIYPITYPIQLNGTARGYAVGDDTRLSLGKLTGGGVVGYPANYCLSGFRKSYTRTVGQGLVIPKFFLSTVNLLPNPAVKSTSLNMKIEYSLTEDNS